MKKGEGIPLTLTSIEGKCICTQSLGIWFPTDKFLGVVWSVEWQKIYIKGSLEFGENQKQLWVQISVAGILKISGLPVGMVIGHPWDMLCC